MALYQEVKMTNQEKWIAFMTIVRREIHRFLRIWPQTLLPPVIIFGTLIGSRIGEMSGLPYIQFVAPGLIMMSVITNSYSNVVSSFFGSKFQSNIEELLVSPTPNWIILLGYVVGGM
jgi:ABC-2 type transport system permease protein